MQKTILSLLAPTLLLVVGQIAAVALGFAVHWVAKRRGYDFGGLASLNPLPKDISKHFDTPGKKLTWIVRGFVAVCFIAGIIAGTIVSSSEESNFWFDLWPELIGIGITVLVIDELNRRRIAQEYKQGIIRQMASRSNDFALDAARIAKNEEWLCDGSLEKADLRNANLSKAPLENARLIGVSLTDAKLEGAELYHANLTAADLLAADLEGAKLWKANLAGADLRRANLKAEDLLAANLAGALYDTETQWPDNFDPKLQGAMHRSEMSAQEYKEWRRNFYN